MRYAPDAKEIIRSAAAAAREMGHSYVGSAHLLLALLRKPGSHGQLLRGAGAETALTESVIAVLYGMGTPAMPLPQGFSGQARRILRVAGSEARLQKSKQVESIHLLLALLRVEKTAAQDIMLLSGVDSHRLFTQTVEYVKRGAALPRMQNKEAVKTKLLEQFSEDLILKAGTMEPVIGRDTEIETVIGILSRKNKNNPALIGEPGVGKTAIAEGLAQRMAAGNVPPQLKEKSRSDSYIIQKWQASKQRCLPRCLFRGYWDSAEGAREPTLCPLSYCVNEKKN